MLSDSKPEPSKWRKNASDPPQDGILRKTPCYPDYERAILTAMLQWPGEVIPEIQAALTGEHFYVPANRILYETILKLFKDDFVDIIRLQNDLRDSDKIERVGGVRYIAELLNEFVAKSSVEWYASELSKAFAQRKVIRECTELVCLAYDGGISSDDLAAKLYEISESILENESSAYETSPKAAVRDFIEEFERAYESKSPLIGVSTGFEKLDEMTCGFVAGELWYLGGLSGTGKTGFELNLFDNLVASETPVAAGVFSMEMYRKTLIRRVIARRTKINSQVIGSGLKGLPGPAQITAFNRIMKEISSLRDAPFQIDHRSGLTLNQIRSQARKWVKKHGTRVIFIDYLSLIRSEGTDKEENLRLAELSKGLLGLARDLKITIVVLAQMNRQVTASSRPKKEQLRGASQLENDAHVIVLLQRMDPDNPAETVKVDAIIAKCREGREGFVTMDFNKETSTFTETTNFEAPLTDNAKNFKKSDE